MQGLVTKPENCLAAGLFGFTGLAKGREDQLCVPRN